MNIDHAEVMNALFVDLQNLLGDERAAIQVKEMIHNILELKSLKWGCASNSGSTGSLTSSDSNKSSLHAWVSYNELF